MEKTLFPGNKAGMTCGILGVCLAFSMVFWSFGGKCKAEKNELQKEMLLYEKALEASNQCEIEGLAGDQV